jgi:hypothetical protein
MKAVQNILYFNLRNAPNSSRYQNKYCAESIRHIFGRLVCPTPLKIGLLSEWQCSAGDLITRITYWSALYSL